MIGVSTMTVAVPPIVAKVVTPTYEVVMVVVE